MHYSGVAGPIEPRLEQILEFCAADPVECVFLEDVARRGLGRFTATSPTMGGSTRSAMSARTSCPPAPTAVASPRRRHAAAHKMIIGDERAVTELWDEPARQMPEPRDDRMGQPVYELTEPPPPGETGLRAATDKDFELLVPACAAAHEEEIGVDPLARDAGGLPLADPFADPGGTLLALGGGRGDPVQGRGVGMDAGRGADPTGVGRSAGARPGFAQRGMRDLCRLLLKRVPAVCLFVRPENAPAIRVYEAIGMERCGSYRSLIF